MHRLHEGQPAAGAGQCRPPRLSVPACLRACPAVQSAPPTPTLACTALPSVADVARKRRRVAIAAASTPPLLRLRTAVHVGPRGGCSRAQRESHALRQRLAARLGFVCGWDAGGVRADADRRCQRVPCVFHRQQAAGDSIAGAMLIARTHMLARTHARTHARAHARARTSRHSRSEAFTQLHVSSLPARMHAAATGSIESSSAITSHRTGRRLFRRDRRGGAQDGPGAARADHDPCGLRTNGGVASTHTSPPPSSRPAHT